MRDCRRRLLAERDGEVGRSAVATDRLDLVHPRVQRIVAHGARAAFAVVARVTTDLGLGFGRGVRVGVIVK